MPRYDYRCPQCGEVAEFTMTVEERMKNEVECLECGVWCEPILSPPALVFKGTGWTEKGSR